MKRKNLLSGCLAAALFLLYGCGTGSSQQAVYVQTVGNILGYSQSETQFSGVIESSKTQTIERDENKTISEILVQQGDTVKKGDVLFTYNKEELQLSVDSAKLELESIQNKITSYQEQIAQLKTDKKNAGKSEQLEYNLQIQEAQLELSSAQYELKKKQKELTELQTDLAGANVTAEADGVVQSISYSGSDDGTNTFMTILETGTYQIKGTVSELEISELSEGEAVTIRSRADDQTWSGTISKIDTDGAADTSTDSTSDESGESSSKYFFYVVPNSQEGMLIGQHVYLSIGETEEANGLWLSSDYIVQDGEEAYVWLSNDKGLLEKRTVTLGRHNEESNTDEITDGLTLEDYIAFPDDSLREGDPTTVSDGTAGTDEALSSEDADESGVIDSGEIIGEGGSS